ncbi:MAG: 16S rRNA (cytosine(1402)-N(4))-methyltransferase RsmH [Deltaproteobacteria bacterium]|nr:16S rRNA (cytosine(1402)-N(4))-methyltransferase RsmH [Deltaproteobacteria bacterium]MBW2382112.1 16S rRNA (cytosine(1402)-N(4))-methyltransferase RsmH [Deltaproteobacteria bacterium]
MSNQFHHQPVLLTESIEQLDLSAGDVVVDGTLGGGGHAAAILECIAPDGVLVGLDVDAEALAAAHERLQPFGERAQLVHASFRRLDHVIRSLGLASVDAVLLDLGVSSHQLDVSGRGFRFAEMSRDETPLDMRMDTTRGRTAAELLRHASEEELQGFFQRYGELPGSRRLARAIAAEREREPLRTAADLLRVIDSARIGRGRRHNPATLVFQALRIAVNDELGALEDGLDAAVEVLRPGGRLVVIAYHSLEDRIVKHRFRAEAKGCICPPAQPVCTCGRKPRLRVDTRRPIRPSEEEVGANPRSRSALLRAAERIAEAI